MQKKITEKLLFEDARPKTKADNAVVIGEIDRPARPETFELIKDNFEDW
jgi:hypothetical protein